MYQKVLVPLDGSAASELALARAVELVARSSGEVHAVTVAEVEGVDGSWGRAGAVPAEAVDRAEVVRAAEEYLDAVARLVVEHHPEVELSAYVLPSGSVVSVLLREITAEEIDLVVMSTHGRGGPHRAWLGSTADGVLRQASRPILLLRPSASDSGGARSGARAAGAGTGLAEGTLPRPFRRVLVPLDGSEDAAEVLPHAREMAGTEGARVSLLAVVPPLTEAGYPRVAAGSTESAKPADEGPASATGHAAADEAAEDALEDLERRAEELRGEGIEVDVELLRGARPAPAILERVGRGDVDLVAMATRGRGGAPRLIVGSVADKVIRASEIPVLVHRPRRRDEG